MTSPTTLPTFAHALVHRDDRGIHTLQTFGALLQKRVQQAPTEVLPLQYLVTLLLCLCLAPFQPFHFEASMGFLIPVLFLGLVISVGAQLLLYRLIRRGNLVNVTSLFYLVPVVTVILDYLILGNAMPRLAMAGMVAILAGLVLVFREPVPSGLSPGCSDDRAAGRAGVGYHRFARRFSDRP